MIWSREEDMTHDFYRPISQCKLSAGLDDDGNLVGLHVRVSGQSINAYLNPALITDGKDMRQLQGYDDKPGEAQLGYGVPNMLIEYVMRNTHVPVGPWRGVNTNQNAVYMECFMDEVAHAAGKDPLEFRRSLMEQLSQASRRASTRSAEKAGWGKPLPAGVHRGIAQFHGLRQLFGGGRRGLGEPTASSRCIAWCSAINCGHAVNPDQIAAQMEGSVAFGLSAALYGEMSVKDGRMVQTQLRHLPAHAHGRDAEGRNHDHADLRLLGRRRRADHLRRHARRAQRDLRRDRQAGAQPAAQEREARLASSFGATPQFATLIARPRPGDDFMTS